jgi:hypothetical protein
VFSPAGWGTAQAKEKADPVINGWIFRPNGGFYKVGLDIPRILLES